MVEKPADVMEKIVSLCKRRGFLFQGSEIYGGIAGMWDYGSLGVALKNNIKNVWWKMFVTDREDMYGVDAAIIMDSRAWVASGHVAGFSDPLIECTKCQRRFRADHLLNSETCPECGGKLGVPRQFNMMFQTSVGAVTDSSSIAYLRPETAGGMFVNFKNTVDSLHPKMPFGLAQIGKAFRNEITPRDFIFRAREFEQMEIEYFVKAAQWNTAFELWRVEMRNFMSAIGLDMERVRELEVAPHDRAHYSKRTIDFEFEYPFGRKELYGLAYRTDFDLSAHQKESTVDLSYFDEETKERFVPHVIEPSFGIERSILAVLVSAYHEDEMNGEVRTYLKLAPHIAPYRAAVSPLLKNKPELVAKAREVYTMLKKQFGNIAWDDNGNIGKRYRRQDEIGTPYCIVIDFDTLGEKPEHTDTVTIRNRDTGAQERIHLADIAKYIQ
jgi:glycyl-tRNA synthetase